MRVGQLTKATRNTMFMAGLFLIGLSSAVGLVEPPNYAPAPELLQHATAAAPAAPATPALPCQRPG